MNFIYDLLEMSLLGQSIIVEFSEVSARTPLNLPSLTAHYHDMWELIFAHDDMLSEQTEDRVINLKENDLILIPPGTRHRCADMSRKAPVVSVFKLHISNTDRSNLTSLLRSRACTPIAVDSRSAQYLDELKEMYAGWRRGGRKDYILAERISAKLKLFLCDVLEAMLRDKDTATLSYKKKDFIESNIIDYISLGAAIDDKCGDITIERLAETIGYSVEHTERMIKRKYGKSFRTLMYENKLERAKALLCEHEISIDRIAEMLGYKNTKSFSESFRSGVGKTPAEYRHECKIQKRLAEL